MGRKIVSPTVSLVTIPYDWQEHDPYLREEDSDDSSN